MRDTRRHDWKLETSRRFNIERISETTRRNHPSAAGIHPADAAQARSPQCGCLDAASACQHRRDHLHRQAWLKPIGRDGPGFSVRHDGQAVIRRCDGRGGVVRNQSGAWCLERGSGQRTGASRDCDRRIARAPVHRGDAGVRALVLQTPWRQGRRARRSDRILRHPVLRRIPGMAEQHPRIGPSRHRQYADTIGRHLRGIHSPDHARRRSDPWRGVNSLAWHARRRHRLHRRKCHQRGVLRVVPVERTRQDQATVFRVYAAARDVFRHSESGGRINAFTAAVCPYCPRIHRLCCPTRRSCACGRGRTSRRRRRYRSRPSAARPAGRGCR